MSPYALLGLSVLFEVFGDTCMKLSEGFKRKVPIIGIVVVVLIVIIIIVVVVFIVMRTRKTKSVGGVKGKGSKSAKKAPAKKTNTKAVKV